MPDAHRRRAVDSQEADPGVSAVCLPPGARLPPRPRGAALTAPIAFQAAPEPVLAFVRRTAGEALLCVFNFAASPAEWVPPASLGPVARLDFPGAGRHVADSVELPAYGVFFARLDTGPATA